MWIINQVLIGTHPQDPKWQIEALFATCARRQDHSLKMYHMCLEKPHQRHIPCSASSNLWHRQLSARPTFKKWSTENTTGVAKMWCLPAILNHIIKYPANFSVAKYFPFHTTLRVIRCASVMSDPDGSPDGSPIPPGGGNVEGVGMQLLHQTAGNVFGWRLKQQDILKGRLWPTGKRVLSGPSLDPKKPTLRIIKLTGSLVWTCLSHSHLRSYCHLPHFLISADSVQITVLNPQVCWVTSFFWFMFIDPFVGLHFCWFNPHMCYFFLIWIRIWIGLW